MKRAVSVLGSLVWALSLAAAPGLAAAQPTSSTPTMPAPAAAPSTSGSGRPSTVIERVLVRVNGEILTQSQLTARQIEALRAEGTDQSQVEAKLAEITPHLLVAAVDELLLVQRGRELGISFSDETFKSAVENIKKQNNLDDAGLRAALAQEGMTMDDLRRNIEQSYFIQGVQQREIGPSMTITLEEQRQYYKRNPDKFMTPLTVTIRELLVNVPTRVQSGKEVFSVADDEAAKEKIAALRTRAVQGEDFAGIVGSESDDTAARKTGGLIGPLNVEDLSPALQELLVKLEPGQVSEPVRGPRGYLLYKLEERSTPELRPFDEVRREIEQAIRSERIEPETQKMLARLRAQAVIQWKDENLQRLYEQRIAELAAIQ
jgi:peptidyl-prolyl cis-trans isomerase SurA